MKSRYMLLAALFSVVTLGHSQGPTPEVQTNHYTITILGEVSKPGFYAFNAERTVTLLQVYAMAQGATRDANVQAVEIKHAPKVNAAGVSLPSEIIRVDLRSILTKRTADIHLEPGDVITVPRRMVAPGPKAPGLIAGIAN
jgi:protein involved in polysaccharide export with SLBB domain